MTLMQILRRWRLFLCMLALGAIAGLLFAMVQTPRYVANMTISALGLSDAPIQTGLTTGGTGVLQALKGIAGQGAGALGDGDYAYFIALLYSDRTVSQLINSQSFVESLFPDEWDVRNKRWRRAPGFVSRLSGLYISMFFSSSYAPPSVPRVKERLAKIMSVQFDLETNQHVISVRSPKCAVSRRIISTVFSTADNVLKAERSKRSVENITYLQTQIADQRNALLRSEIATALVLQYVRQISAQSKLPLAARVIDGPDCNPRPTLPQPISYAFLGAILGFVLTLAFVVLKNSIKIARQDG
jgi:hypothetical protein